MDTFARISTMIDDPAPYGEDAPALVRRLLLRLSKDAHPAAAEAISRAIDAFNGDYELLVASQIVAGGVPLVDLQDRLMVQLKGIRRLIERPSETWH